MSVSKPAGAAAVCRVACGLLLLLVLSGCALMQRAPQGEPVPPPPPVVVEAAVPESLRAPVAAAWEDWLVVLAESALAVGLDAGADALAAEVVRGSPASRSDARIRALTLRALVALRHGGVEESSRALAYMRAARQLETGAAGVNPLQLNLMVLEMLERQGKELETARSRLNASRRQQRQEQEEAAALRQQVVALEKQLDELKSIHLQIESDKKDEPSR